MKKYSLEFWFLAGFMILQQVFLWFLQVMGYYSGKNLILEDFHSVAAIAMGLILILRWLKKYREGIEADETAEGRLTAEPERGKKKWQIKSFLTADNIAKLLLFVLLILGALSTAFGLDPFQSLTGRFNRFEGLYSLAAYYFLCWFGLNLKSEKEQKLLLYIFCGIGAFASAVGILSLYYVIPEALDPYWQGRSAIPYGNPNFYASMMSMVEAVSFGMFVYGQGRKLRAVGMITFIMSIIATFGCQSTSAVVGNIMIFLITFFMETLVFLRTKAKKKESDIDAGKDTSFDAKADFKKRMLSALLMLAVYIGCATFVNETSGRDIVLGEIESNINYIDEGFTSDKMFSNRMIIWKYCFQEIKKYPLLGVGPENLILITRVDGNSDELKTYDKAHNEYINVMICEGIPAAIINIAFLFVIFVPWILNWRKRTKSFVGVSMFLAFFAYIAQAFFNISMIQVAPYFWIICGLSKSGGVSASTAE